VSLFDRYIMVDWSGGNDRGLTPKKDAIWVCVDGEEPIYMRNRQLAEKWLQGQIQDALGDGSRLAIGFDFPFAYPIGFAAALTGNSDPFAVWEWLEARIEDAPKVNNRFDIAGKINAMFDGIGPFWGNGLARDIEDLPRKGLARTLNPFPEKRQVETLAKGSFTCWQLFGAGTVGSQVLMGLPVLQRLRSEFRSDVSVWPFEPLTSQIAFLEIWPSLISNQVEGHGIKDAAQVKTVANTLARMDQIGELKAVLEIGSDGAEEGWIVGVGAEDVMAKAAKQLTAPALSNDCFALPAGVQWTPVDDALTMLKAAMKPVVGSQVQSVLDSCGAVLSNDVMAKRSNPPAANSAVDGYGFAHASLPQGEAVLPLVVGRAAAGAAYQGVVSSGSAIRILTGAILPDGVDTVVLEEDCNTSETHVAFQADLRAGSNTRKAGEDVEAGQLALKAGHSLRAQDLALLTALGVSEIDVRKPLRVGVLSTGDELVAASDNTPADRTFDANRPMLLSIAKAWGYEAVDLGHVGDDRSALNAKFDEAAQRCDAILTTGGASAGDEDHVSALLRETGSLNEWRIALKPGRPLALGVWQGVPVFGLPGNPVAAFTCALIFARPALSRLAGGPWLSPQAFMVPAAFSKRKKPGRREFLRARINEDGQVERFASEGSGRISGLSWSDGFVELPDGECEVNEGDLVRYLPYSGFGL
jgi:molybdopterin molybdotransferase